MTPDALFLASMVAVAVSYSVFVYWAGYRHGQAERLEHELAAGRRLQRLHVVGQQELRAIDEARVLPFVRPGLFDYERPEGAG